MYGTVCKIWENQTKEGVTFWVLSINGQKYGVWDKNLMQGLKEGDTVDFLWQPAGKYRTVTHLTRIESAPSAPTGALGAAVDQKSRHIIRMSCVRSAAELLKGRDSPTEERLEAALQIAEELEKHVLRPDSDQSSAKETREEDQG